LQDCDFFIGLGKNKDVERRFEVRQDKLAILTADNMLLPEVKLVGRKRAIVIGSQHFRVGAETGGRSANAIETRRGGAQMAGERFFKGPIAVVRRHGFLLS
jgi:hypothetical protein